jgi:acetyltransferase-like isoleucine patch superfamily enzyme
MVNAVWCAEVRARGVELGAGVIFNGRPYLHREAGSRIVIGDRVVLNSYLRSNPIGVARPVSLRTMRAGAELILGPDVGLSGVSICAAQRVEIGEGTYVGADTVIFDNDFHAPKGEWNWGPFSPENPKAVLIGRGVFIGARAIILKGVTIGDRAIVGAGAVLTKNVPARGIAAGNPARVLPARR